MKLPHLVAAGLFAAACTLPAMAQAAQRNIVIFVADGLRYSSVTPETAPTMWKIKTEGVDFTNSHAMYPTLTTANASAIATGHYLGDTGDYANVLSLDYPVQCQLNNPMSIIFLEDDCVLRSIKQHFGDGYMGQTTLMQAAKAAGYNTLVVGKKGPSAIQWIGALDSQDDDVNGPLGIMVDDSTNHPKNVDGTPTGSTVLHGDIALDVFGATGAGAPAFTSIPNLTQQSWLTSLTTQVLIPDLKNAGKPFVMLFWSRDPDATQHSAIDSSGHIVPGINSIDAHAAIYNADTDLKYLLDALKLAGMADNTDVFVTADHGFSTIGKGIPTADGALPVSTLGVGFVALDVSHWLNEKLFDPDHYSLEVDVAGGERPAGGSGLVGPDAAHPKAIVVANGGSDFIYVPDASDKRATAKKIYDNLIQQPYVGALFVNDALLKNGNPADFGAALPMSDINLIGSATVPRPDFVIGFRSFDAKGCKLGEQLCAVEIADTGLQTGQGMHGSFSRADTRNFMAAIGPDFKNKFADKAPVSNADITPTMAYILKIDLGGGGSLKGRPATEALKGGANVVVTGGKKAATAPLAEGKKEVLQYQQVGETRYFDAAGVPGRVVGVSPH
jgi:arylsulfatase A-like enzyme